MKISEVKQEYQLQQWSGMLRERQERGLSVKVWCAERGSTEHVYDYRLRKLRQAARTALEQVRQICFLCLFHQPGQVASMKTTMRRWDEWLRRRLRVYIWKQWKVPKARMMYFIGVGSGGDTFLSFYPWCHAPGTELAL